MRTAGEAGMGGQGCGEGSWPYSTGMMADAIRGRDWSSTALGPIETWPPALRFAVADILESRFASAVAWGPQHIGLYNDACVPIFGERPDPLGRPFDMAWADVWNVVRFAYESAFAGAANYFEDLALDVPRPGLPDRSWWTFSCTPIRDEAGRIGGVKATILETTRRVRLERCQAALLRIDDALRGLDDPVEIEAGICAELGRHLGAGRVDYAEIDLGEGIARVGRGWACDGHPDGGGRYALNAFGAGLVDRLSSGGTAAVADIGSDPLTAGGSIYASLGIGAFLVVPLIRDGRWVNGLSVAMPEPHRWTGDEIAVTAAVAERTWETVERVRAGASLRESRRRLDAALEAARMVAWDWDPATDRITTSGRIDELFGLVPDQSIATSLDGFAHLHPDDRERHRATVAAAGERRAGYESEFRIVRPRDGQTAWLEERARTQADPATGETSLTGLVWDVTRRKTAEIAGEEARREVADELTVLTRLHDWAVRVARPAEWPVLIDEMLAAAMVVLQADFGTVRIYDPEEQTFTITAHRGCEKEHVERYATLSARDETGVFHRLMASHRRIIFDEAGLDCTPGVVRDAAALFGIHAFHVTPLFDRTGSPVGALSTGFYRASRPTEREWRLVDLYGVQIADVIGARRARDALAASEQRQRRLIESVPQLVWRSLRGGYATWHSPQWFAYTGHRRDQSLGRGWLDAMHPEDRPAALAAWTRAEECGAYECEGRFWSAREGRYRWFQERAVAETLGDDGTAEWIGTSTDIDALRTLHEHQRTLLVELQHRVRQTLSRLRTIVRRTAETREDIDDYVLRLDSRLDALARAQGPALRDPSAGIDLYELVANELTAHQAREGGRTGIAGPPLRLRQSAADVLALALHELAINAVEHGALSHERGRIKVCWRIEVGQGGGPLLHFDWTETGCRCPERNEPPHEGFGFSFLKRALSDEFGAGPEIALAPGGLRFSVEVPLTSRVVMP